MGMLAPYPQNIWNTSALVKKCDKREGTLNCTHQHHVFMDWRFVYDSPKGMLRDNWELGNSALNDAGVESMQAKWDEMFGEKKER